VIENEQREGLKPLELALFVQKRLALGDNQAEIARRLGKSRQWVTLATALIEPPDWLLDAYRRQRCQGLTELYELRRLHGQWPQQVEAWVGEGSIITRDRLTAFRGELSVDAAGDAACASAAANAPATHASSAADLRGARDRESVRLKGHRQRNRALHVEF
jgi:ParB family chromosome partitioning protein